MLKEFKFNLNQALSLIKIREGKLKMSSETIPKLPIIDFNNLNLEAKSPNWESVKSQVYKALEEYGCFEAILDKVPLDLRKTIFSSLEELFDLPLQTKQLNVSKKLHHGYLSQYPMLPLYESIGIDDANIFENVESLTNILWPDGNQSFSKTVHTFSEELLELDQIIRKMILESLGVEKYLEEHMNSTSYLLRFMKYKGPQTSDTKVGLKAHTDKNTVTILYQNQVEGLEVMNKDGKWISYKPSLDSFVVLAWSNGRLHSPLHRVMMSGNEARYSIALGSIPKEECIIKAPDELVDDEHPLLFKPYVYDEFLKYFFSEKGQRDQFAMRTYCGV
ncbi:probable 2-oxoglutarate-dependent dioxygenase AOP1 isoform X2 [Cicer arietinum]|uniref:Probable 2-oxoglutarate-dependent dioxygenase AOP1 isoform X2 n=1 Tax=Cicer arietinum TaxID=3827 RepID=A0A3Q7Y1R7_CICAR|nr:probable 2-oxoglutarate-dependent dioxygenase AOP1 isoform X2 [Cicer arietinum]